MGLFTSIHVGRNRLAHRLVMAPMARFRADDAHVHGDMAVEYYSQRASVPGTLIITEATILSPKAIGFFNAPMIHGAERIAAWKRVTDAVHAKGSFIYCQLWAPGRELSPELLQATGQELLSSSPIPMEAGKEVPREMTEAEIWAMVGRFVQAAKNAIEAGFDGVEVHGANGFLIDQFIQDVSNQRTDGWGGSVENRARFCLEITRAVAAAIGADRVGVRLSPFSVYQGMGMADPIPQFSYLIRCLKDLKISYLHMVESRICGNADLEPTEKLDFAIDIWDNISPFLIAGGFTPGSARRAVEEEYKGKDIMIVFGRYFTSNPDLPFRIQKGIDLEPYNRETFYLAKSPKGYADYPFSKDFELELHKGIVVQSA